VPRKILAVLLAWALMVLDAAVPAYAVGGLGELRDAGGKGRRHATGGVRRRQRSSRFRGGRE
jgi:hypothetical protein